MNSSTADRFAELAAAVARCVESGPSTDSHDELGDDLRELRRLINLLELTFARSAGRYRQGCEEELGEDPVAWLRSECHMTSGAAAVALEVGAHEAQLPKSLGAFTSGRIGLAHLGLLAHVADFAAYRSVPQPFAETALLAKAERKTIYHFRKDCLHAQHALDAQACVQSAVYGVEYRRLQLTGAADGSVSVSGYLDPEGAALVRTALEPLAAPSGGKDFRSREQRLGDALVELAAHRLDNGQIPQRGGQRSHLLVTTGLETLQALRGAAAADLEHGGLIPDHTVQRLACDATVTRVILNAESAVIDVGRAQRVVPGATRRALKVRDKGCRWPGCERSASWTQAHHIVHWVHNGKTDIDNLVLLCHRHHWMVHEVGFQIVRTEDGGILTVAPDPDINSSRRPPPQALAAA